MGVSFKPSTKNQSNQPIPLQFVQQVRGAELKIVLTQSMRAADLDDQAIGKTWLRRLKNSWESTVRNTYLDVHPT